MTVAEAAVVGFRPVTFTCPKSPDFQFVYRERLPGTEGEDDLAYQQRIRGQEYLLTQHRHFTNGGFVATTPEEEAVIERMQRSATSSMPKIYRETSSDRPMKCPRCFFRTGHPDAFNEHIALCTDS